MQELLNNGGAMMAGNAGQHDLISKAAMLNVQVQVAKQYGRVKAQVRKEIIEECQMPELALVAMYAYPRGGQVVTGPSIRLVEAIAACMGNIEYGIVELEQTDKEVLLEAFAWDIQKNVRRSMRWTIPMERSTRNGSYALTDQRDRYEMMANMGMRRVRACLMALIPYAYQQLAIETVQATLANHSQLLTPEKQTQMLNAFARHGVEQGHLEKYLGHSIANISRQEAINLSTINQSLEAGIGKAADFFAGYVDKSAKPETPASSTNESVNRVNEKLKKAQGDKA